MREESAMSKYTKAQQMMLDDGCPEFLIRTEDREAALREAWVRSPPKPMPIFSATTARPAEPKDPALRTEAQKIAANKFEARVGRARQKRQFVPGAIWDTKTCSWVHPAEEQRRRIEDMTAKLKGEKTVAELTAEYNALATAAGKPPVKKFKDRATALQRLAKVSAAASPPPQNVGSSTDLDVVKQFKFKPGSPREQLLRKLLANLGSQVSRKDLGSLESVVGGITWRIDESKLPYRLMVVKDVKEGKSYGLYPREVLS